MKRRIVTLLLAAVLLLGLAACNNAPAPSTSGPAPSASSQPTKAPQTQAPDAPPVEVTVVGYTSSPTMTDFQMVLDAINEILIRDINIKLNLDVGVSFSNYYEQMNLRLAGQEEMDWILSGTHYNFPDSVAKGYFNPLNDLIEDYGQNIVDIITYDYLAPASYGGEIYGIPQRRDLAAASSGMLYRKDILEKYDLSVDGVKSVQDFEPIFDVVYANEPERIMYYSGPPTGPLKTLNPFCDMDNLGTNDDISLLYPFDSTEIQILPETSEYAEMAALMRSWYAKGFLLSDAATDTTPGGDYMKNDRLFSYTNTYHANSLTQAYNHTGFDRSQDVLDCIQVSTMKATTSTVNVFLWCQTVFSPNPVEAMQFLDYMYGSEEVINLLVNGIEGKHYVKTNDGYITYPEGITRDNCGYRLGTAWLWGDQFKNYTWVGGDKEAWNNMNKDNLSAKKSNALGFMFNVEDVKSEYSAVINVYNEFAMAISAGIAPESAVADYAAKLKAAGAETIRDAKQEQLDAWLADR